MKLGSIPALLLAVGMIPLAHADFVFSTPTGAVDTAGDPVSAMADFHFNGTNWVLTLTDTLAGIKDVGQALTDIFFSVSSGTAALGTQTGNLIDVGAGGVVNDGGTSSDALSWGFGGTTISGHSGFELCTICQGGVTASSTPTEAILGPVSADGKYDNANGSIDSNAGHNPFVEGSATFTLTGLSSSTTFSNILFSFGTTPGDNVPSTVPEPTSLLVLGLGLAGLVYRHRRERA
jgi:PEP-CTERM motif-containing protein